MKYLEAFNSITDLFGDLSGDGAETVADTSGIDSFIAETNQLAEKVILYLSDYYLLFALIGTTICTIWAVLARKNKGSRRTAMVFAVLIPAICFVLYIGGFIYCDIKLGNMSYRMLNDEYVITLPDSDGTMAAYKNMYFNARALYTAYGETKPGLTFNFHFTFGTLFISTALWFAIASVLYGLTLRFICVKDTGMARWANLGLLLLIPSILIIGTIIYRWAFASGRLY